MFDVLVHKLFINRTLIAAVLSWLVAQLLKFLGALILEGKLDFTKLTSPGGMPSGHAAMVTAMAVSIGENSGWESNEFGLAVVFALVVMYDAAGVRQAVGKQARVLNALMRELPRGKASIPTGLKELLGHTPVEVMAGSVLGIVFAILI